MVAGLRARRREVADCWERYLGADEPNGVRGTIAESWRRSRRSLAAPVQRAPVDTPDSVAAASERSLLRRALPVVADDLVRTAETCDLVAAVTDATGRIVWTAGSRHMRRRADQVNFVPGGRWDEASVGTNALGLALVTGGVESVFSAEHYSACVHDWVCYAAAVRQPGTGDVLGVVDLSTTWDRSHPMASATVAAYARMLGEAVRRTTPARSADRAGARSRARPDGGLFRLKVLGTPALEQAGLPLVVTLRQAEILLTLALHPAGLTLEQLHAFVYGDAPVALGTLKAEVSRLRRVLGGALASRPYRVTLPVQVDALDVLDAVARGDTGAAVDAAADPVLPAAESPVVAELRVRVEVAVRRLVLSRSDAGAAARLAQRHPYDNEVVEHALALLPARAPARTLLMASHEAALALP
jgi:hypothetical protein